MPPRLAALVLTTLALPLPVRAQDDSESALAAVTAGGAERRTLFHDNKRIAGTAKVYAVEAKDGRFSTRPHDDWDFEAVADAAGNQRYTVTAARGQPRRLGTGSYSTPEIDYMVLRDGEAFAVKNFVSRRDQPSEYLRRKSAGAAGLASSFDGSRSVEIVGAILSGDYRVTHELAVGPARREAKFGREVLAVPSTLTPNGMAGGTWFGGVIRQTSYFDPAHAHAFVGAEADDPGSMDRPWPHRVTCVLEYQPRPDGRPVPRRFTRHFRPEGGEPLPEYEVEFARYEDYTPTADDFRLEARYGLPTPTGPDDKPVDPVKDGAGSRGGLWWSVAAGAAVVVVGVGLVGFVAYRRRRQPDR